MTRDEKRGRAADETPELKVSRVLHARRETVFRAFGSAEHLKRWFPPETFSAPEATVQMRVGGPFEVCFRSPAGEVHWVRGRFLEVVPNSRLVIDMTITDVADQALFRARTEVDFLEAPGGTRIEVVQRYTVLAAQAAWMVKGAPEGWRSSMEKLAQEVLRMERQPAAASPSVVHGVFHLERTYPVAAERVWKAFTDESAKARWFGPPAGGWELIERRMDVRTGGTERLKGRWPGGLVTTFDALYHDVVPNARLIYSYQMFLDERKISVSLATVQLEAESARTRLLVSEQGAFLDGYDDAGARERGTAQLLDALGASLT
jgi:uncharacterized protein YndB with AHSA1/START domain